jgi:predicted PhzF superfamily epimerase YddE/YHI9
MGPVQGLVPRVITPFQVAFEPGDPPEAYAPGYVLALARAAGLPKGDGPGRVESPWGTHQVETRSEGQLVASTPAHAVTVPRVMTAVAARALGLSAEDVDATDRPIQELDVGRRVLVVPLPSKEHLADMPDEAELGKVPMVSADQAIAYARTHRSPYAQIQGRLIGEGDPLLCLAAASLHLVYNLGVRPTYPRTRVVARLVGHGEERAEVTVAAKKAGHEPKVQTLFVGGRVTDGA